MPLSESELLPGEHVLVSKNANAVVEIVQAGPGSMSSVDITGTEAVGGQLYLTDLRLIFRAHRVNRLRGGFTIPLSTITQVRDTSSGLRRQIEIVTPLERFTFIVWGAAQLIARIEALRGAVAVEPEIPLCYKCGMPLDPGDPRFNLPWPDPVADMTEEERDEHVRFSSDAVVATDNFGGFARALLPVPLTDGRTATIGVWISVEVDVYVQSPRSAAANSTTRSCSSRVDWPTASTPGANASSAPRSRRACQSMRRASRCHASSAARLPRSPPS